MEIGNCIDFSPRNCRIKSIRDTHTMVVEDVDGKELIMSYIPIHKIYVDKEKQDFKGKDFVSLFNRLTCESRPFYAKIYNTIHRKEPRVVQVWSGEEGPEDCGKDAIEQRLFDCCNSDPTKQNVQVNLRGPLNYTKKAQIALARDSENKIVAIRSDIWIVNGRHSRRITSPPQMLFYCDVCPYPSELGQTNPELPSADYLATIAWVGEKPAEELCQKSRAIGKETIIGALTLLIKNEDGIATFGVIEPLDKEKIGKNVKIWFDRKHFYMFGTCLENADLSRLLSYITVLVHLDPSRQSSVSEEVRKNLAEFYGEKITEELIFVEATCVTHGLPTPKTMVFVNPEEKTKPESADGLANLLAKKSITIQEFQEMVSGQDPTSQIIANITNAKGANVSATDAIHKAQIIELQKPELFTKTSVAVMRFIAGPFTNQEAIVKSSNIFIFGRCLKSANLMDFYNKDDVYDVMLTDNPLNAEQKAEIVAAVTEKKKSYDEICSLYNNVPKSFIVEWIKEAKLGVPKSFYTKGERVELPIKLAWIGQFEPRVRCDDDNPGFKKWMYNHWISNFDEFFTYLTGSSGSVSPYFPVLKIVRPMCAIVHSIYPPSPENANHFGFLQITSDPLTNQIVPFESDDTYICGQSIGNVGDLSEVFMAGEQVLCEVRKPMVNEQAKWSKILSGKSLTNLKPRYIAYLVYIGNRPVRPSRLTRSISVIDVRKNTQLLNWLAIKGITPKAFADAISGKVPLQRKLLELEVIGKNAGDHSYQNASSKRPPQDNTRRFQHQSFPNLDPRRPIEDPHLSWPPQFNSLHKMPLLSTPIQQKMPLLSAPVPHKVPLLDIPVPHKVPLLDIPVPHKVPLLSTPIINNLLGQNKNRMSIHNTRVDSNIPNKAGVAPVSAKPRSEGVDMIPRPSNNIASKRRSQSPSGNQGEAHECDVIMSKAETIFRKIMGCISPEDPKVDQVITNHAELELAMFMSKTLVSSIISFSKKSKAETEERTQESGHLPDVPVVREDDREECNKGRTSQIAGLDRGYELPSPKAADSARRSSPPFELPKPARHIRKEDSFDHLSLPALPREPLLNPEFEERVREVGSRYHETTRSREDLRETLSRRTTSPESFLLRPETLRTGKESRETLSRQALSPENYSHYPEMLRAREKSRETLPRRTTSPESFLHYPEMLRTRGESRETFSRRRTSPESYSRYPEIYRTREESREALSRRPMSPESYSPYTEMLRTREESRETLSRRTTGPEKSKEVSDLRLRLNPVHADPRYRPIDRADSRSSSNPHLGSKRVGSELRYEQVKQSRYDN